MKGQATLDQLRARRAWSVLEQVRRMHGVNLDEFAREVKRLPVRIRTAGLGQALGFMCAKAKGNDARTKILEDLAEWLLDKRRLARRPPRSDGRYAVIRAIMEGDADLLRQATEEALLYLQWLSRFAEAEVGAE